MISTTNEPRGALTGRSSILAVLADSSPFHGLLLTILARFGVPERFSRLTIPRVRLPVGHQHSQFWPILARFMDYHSLFRGPGVVSMVNEPCGAFTCRSSTLVVLADSDPFHGLLLTVLGSQSDFHGCRTPRCAYVSVINNRSFGRFWPVSWTITQFLAHVVISTTDEHRCVYVSVINI